MKQRFTLLFNLILLSLSIPLPGQQPGHYSLYFMNKAHWNPAYAGLDNSLSITGGFRKQWVDLESSPTSQNLNLHMPLYISSGGIGLNIENDQLGASRSTSATLAYNYQMPLGDGILSFGLAGGVVQRSLDGFALRAPQGTYDEENNIFQHNDDLLPLGKETALVPTFDAGVYFITEKMEIGLSSKNIAEGSASFSTLSISLKRNYFAVFDFHFEVGRSLSLHPSAFIRSDLIQTQTDLGLRLQYNENIFAGASFRGYNSNSIDAAVLLLGFRFAEHFTLAYAYDLTLSDLNAVSNGSHEIMINYNLNKPIGQGRPPNIIYNPRSL